MSAQCTEKCAIHPEEASQPVWLTLNGSLLGVKDELECLKYSKCGRLFTHHKWNHQHQTNRIDLFRTRVAFIFIWHLVQGHRARCTHGLLMSCSINVNIPAIGLDTHIRLFSVFQFPVLWFEEKLDIHLYHSLASLRINQNQSASFRINFQQF